MDKKMTKFNEMEEKKTYTAPFMVMGMSNRTAKNNNSFVSLEIYDGQKTEKINLFDYVVETLESRGISIGTIVWFSITKNGNYYKVDANNWRINTDPDITPANFVHMAPVNPEWMFQNIMEFVKGVDTNPNNEGPYKSLSYLTRKLLHDNEAAFKRSSAAVKMHHNFLSGLAYHTMRMMWLAWNVCGVYRTLDKELLMCAVALHDIGKIHCYETTDLGTADITVTGRLLDHAVDGMMMVHDAAREDVYDPEKIMMLEHMLAAHHGKLDWGAITTPAFPEADMLHWIDMMDSHMNMFEEAYKGQAPATVSKDKVYGLENSTIYKPSFSEM